MRHGEYERRKRVLEAQFREDVELLRDGYQAKLRALEMIWMASPGEALPAAPPVFVSSETLQLSETVPASETVPLNGPSSEPASAPARRRGQVAADIEAALPELPEEFEKGDVVRALGYEPPRATLHRVLEQLVLDGWTVTSRFSNGHNPTRYRKVPPPLEAEGDLG